MEIRNIAHRGARSLAPENTIAAARKAYEIGAFMWELDTGLLADGELIIMHDDTLERTTNVSNVFPEKTHFLLHEFTMAEIRQLEAGSHYVNNDPFKQIEGGKISAESLRNFNQEPIPTLEQALSFTRENHWQVNVEIKSIKATQKDMTIVEKTIALIKAMEMEDDVLISSFNHEYLKRAKMLAPKINTGWLTAVGMNFHLPNVQKTKSQAYHPSLIGLTQKKVTHFQKKDIAVNVWTVNLAKDMEKLINWRVNGIITDFPQTLQSLLLAG